MKDMRICFILSGSGEILRVGDGKKKKEKMENREKMNNLENEQPFLSQRGSGLLGGLDIGSGVLCLAGCLSFEHEQLGAR